MRKQWQEKLEQKFFNLCIVYEVPRLVSAAGRSHKFTADGSLVEKVESQLLFFRRIIIWKVMGIIVIVVTLYQNISTKYQQGAYINVLHIGTNTGMSENVFKHMRDLVNETAVLQAIGNTFGNAWPLQSTVSPNQPPVLLQEGLCDVSDEFRCLGEVLKVFWTDESRISRMISVGTCTSERAAIVKLWPIAYGASEGRKRETTAPTLWLMKERQ